MDVEEVPKTYCLPNCSAMDMGAIRSRFNLFFVPQTETFAWEFLKYGECRDVALFLSENRSVDEACVCNPKFSKNKIISNDQRMPIQDLAGILKSFPNPKEAVFSYYRRQPHLSKKFQVAALRGLVQGAIHCEPQDILWPPIHIALQFLSGGWWQSKANKIKVGFFDGGFAAAYLVGGRHCNLRKGTLELPICTAVALFPRIFKKWTAKMLKHPLQKSFSAGNFESLPEAARPFFKSCVRKRKHFACNTLGAPPKCISLALKMPAVGNPPRAWKNAMRWQIAQIIAEFADLTAVDKGVILNEFVLPEMYQRGDNPAAVKEFLGQVKHAKISKFPCGKRNGQEGLFCPIGTENCAASRGIPHAPDTMTPAIVWASQAKQIKYDKHQANA